MLPTLLGAAVCMRKSCSEVNRGGSQADSHVIKAKWNIRRRGRDQNTTRKGSSKSYREAPHNKESRQKDDSKLDVLSLLRRPGVCVCAAAAASPPAAALQTAFFKFSQRWKKKSHQPD